MVLMTRIVSREHDKIIQRILNILHNIVIVYYFSYYHTIIIIYALCLSIHNIPMSICVLMAFCSIHIRICMHIFIYMPSYTLLHTLLHFALYVYIYMYVCERVCMDSAIVKYVYKLGFFINVCDNILPELLKYNDGGVRIGIFASIYVYWLVGHKA